MLCLRPRRWSPTTVQQLRANVERSGEIGQLVAPRLEQVRTKHQSEQLQIHITGFAKVVGDLIVLERDFLTVPDEELARKRVLLTMVGGQVVAALDTFAGTVAPQRAALSARARMLSRRGSTAMRSRRACRARRTAMGTGTTTDGPPRDQAASRGAAAPHSRSSTCSTGTGANGACRRTTTVQISA